MLCLAEPRSYKVMILFLFNCSLPIICRRKLRPSRRQPPTTFSHRKATTVHLNPKGPAVRIRPGHNQSSSEHRRRNCYRSSERRHPGSCIRPEFRQELGRRQRGPVLSGKQHHSHHRRQRSLDLRRPGLDFSVGSGDSECPKGPRFRIFGRED